MLEITTMHCNGSQMKTKERIWDNKEDLQEDAVVSEDAWENEEVKEENKDEEWLAPPYHWK